LLHRQRGAKVFNDETPLAFGELTMNPRLIKTLALAATVAAVPAISDATPRSAAIDNCVSAFMASLAKHTAPLKLRDSRLVNSGMSPGLRPLSASELVLIATDAHDNHTVGRAICRFDAHGQVIGLEEVPAQSLLPM
jgi:hypothetical protein